MIKKLNNCKDRKKLNLIKNLVLNKCMLMILNAMNH